jgi:predicted site-specific integrase-resolvase
MDDQLLPISAVAEQYGVSRVCVWQWVNEGILPARRLGHFWYVHTDALKSFMVPRRGRPRKGRACA